MEILKAIEGIKKSPYLSKEKKDEILCRILDATKNKQIRKAVQSGKN